MRLFHRRRREPETLPPPPPVRLLSYRVANLQGVGTRQRQEDSFAFVNAMDVTAIRTKGLLAVVADGMGGMEDGRLVSQAAVRFVTEGFARLDRTADPGPQLRQLVLEAGDEVYRRFQGNGGTTIVLCLIFEEKLWWVSVGDSFLYLRRGGGIYRLNRDQNYRGSLYLQAVRSGVLSSAQADADPDGHRLSEFLGSGSIGEADASVRPLALEDGDRLLLCSDGVGGVLAPDELCRCLDGSPAEACAAMEAGIRAAGRRHQDNYTALAIACGY